MSKGTISTGEYKPYQDPGFEASTMELKNPFQDYDMRARNIFDMPNAMYNQPGYQLPQPNQPQQPNQGQQQQQQYFQQMHKNMDGMNEALKQIESMKMPGQQYGGGFNPGHFFGKGATLF